MFDAALDIAAEPIIEWTAYGDLRRAGRQPQPVGRAAGRLPRPTTPERWLALSVDDRRAVGGAGRRSSAGPTWPTDPAPRRPSPAGARRARRARRSDSAHGPPTLDLDEAQSTAARRAGIPAAPAYDPRRIAPAPAVRGPRLLRGRRPPGRRRAAATRPAVPGRRRRPLGRQPGAHASASTTTRSSPSCSASPTTSSPTSRPPASSARPPARTLTGRPTAMPDLFDRFRVIDVDTHLTEPPDVWTARMPAALHDGVPAHRAHRRRATCGWPAASASARPATTRWPGGTASCRRRSRRPTTTSRPSMYDADGPAGVPRRGGHPRAGAVPERRRLRERLLPAPRRPRARRATCVRAYNDFLHRLVQRRPRTG